MVYACNLKKNEENTLVENSTTIEEAAFEEDVQKKDTGTLKLIKESDLISLFNDGKLVDIPSDQEIRSDILAFHEATLMTAVATNDLDWDKYFSGKDNTPSCTSLSEIQKLNQIAYQEQYRLDSYSQGDDEALVGIYGNNIVAGVAFRKYLTDIAKNSQGTRNQIEDFQNGVQTYIVLTDKNEIPVIYAERYGIRAASDSAQIIACKRMLYMMMQGIAQSKKVNSGIETTFPIQEDQLKEFATTHRNMTDFITLYNNHYASVVVGSITGDMYAFVKGLDGRTNSSNLMKYCNEFLEKQAATDSGSADVNDDEIHEDDVENKTTDATGDEETAEKETTDHEE